MTKKKKTNDEAVKPEPKKVERKTKTEKLSLDCEVAIEGAALVFRPVKGEGRQALRNALGARVTLELVLTEDDGDA